MKDVVIVEAFTGYPYGKAERTFAPSSDSVSVPNDFADLIVGKGHARWPKSDGAKARRSARPAKAPAAKSVSPRPAAEPPAQIPAAPEAPANDGDDA